MQTTLRKDQNEYLSNVNKLIHYQVELMDVSGEKADSAINSLKTIAIVLIIVSVIVAIIVAFFITRGITKPIFATIEAAEKISKGEMNVQLATDRKDETGQLMGAMKSMADTIKNMVAEVNKLSEAAINGKLDVRADTKAYQGDFKALVEGVNGTLDAVIKPLNVTAEYVDRISKGEIGRAHV